MYDFCSSRKADTLTAHLEALKRVTDPAPRRTQQHPIRYTVRGARLHLPLFRRER